jgi:hypothetical protein
LWAEILEKKLIVYQENDGTYKLSLFEQALDYFFNQKEEHLLASKKNSPMFTPRTSSLKPYIEQEKS